MRGHPALAKAGSTAHSTHFQIETLPKASAFAAVEVAAMKKRVSAHAFFLRQSS
jgi:hypothetical protein